MLTFENPEFSMIQKSTEVIPRTNRIKPGDWSSTVSKLHQVLKPLINRRNLYWQQDLSCAEDLLQEACIILLTKQQLYVAFSFSELIRVTNLICYRLYLKKKEAEQKGQEAAFQFVADIEGLDDPQARDYYKLGQQLNALSRRLNCEDLLLLKLCRKELSTGEIAYRLGKNEAGIKKTKTPAIHFPEERVKLLAHSMAIGHFITLSDFLM